MEKLTQEEIDRLMESHFSGEEEEIQIKHLAENSLLKMQKYRSVLSAIKRYNFALREGSHEYARDARRYLHHAAHSLWLVNHGFYSRDEFKQYLERLRKSREKNGVSGNGRKK